MDHGAPAPSLYGLMAEFNSPESLVAAAEKAHAAGYRKMDGYVPYPVHGLSDALGVRPSGLAGLTLAGGIFGALFAFGAMYVANVLHYPLNIGGRPYNSWPAFIPITFEATILCASILTVIGMIARNGLPRPHHPVFGAPGFERASQDGFFLCIESDDPLFDVNKTRDFLKGLQPSAVVEVPA
jgi:hypothetical protein